MDVTARLAPWLTGLPLHDCVHHICNFITDGFQHGFGSGQAVQSPTIPATLHGIKHFFAAGGNTFPFDHPHIRMLLKGIRRFDPPRRRKSPVSIRLLETWFHSLDLKYPDAQALGGIVLGVLLPPSAIRDRGDLKIKWLALNGQDISVIDTQGDRTCDPRLAHAVCIKLRGSKTNQRGPATVRMLQRSGHKFLCPVLGALLLFQARHNLSDAIPAAVYKSKHGIPACVSTAEVSRTIKKAAALLGEDASMSSPHSLRAGGATHMYRAGTDAMPIQFHGRWVSDAFKSYTRLCRESVAKLSNNMLHGSKGDSSLY
ncbi:LOW QUALITY PROTEIN: hypothetical protein PHMEG_0007013 [Phytophthora megakarya]|uniref:Tyr recombinase domain-containing protein n=1 Tax=Phytophthora megakarya TaxID=4795 RepID=A0A225WPD0_9STRA|nr:LOW QUALITY PROTEIN: hypothetical protein PHMEG_0007013 [Phytophthora megakarya]